MEKTTGIIILNYNNETDTINCIESVRKYNTHPIKFIIVDNGSNRKDCVEIIKKYILQTFENNYSFFHDNPIIERPLPLISFIISSTNDGYAQGNNKGLNLAYQDTEISNILILNNDILFVEDIIPELVKTLYTIPNAAIVSPLLYKKNLIEIDFACARKELTLKQRFLLYLFLFRNAETIYRHTFILYDKDLSSNEQIIEIELPSGSCMLIDKKYFKSIDSFDPHTFLYCEEDILYRKVTKTRKKNYLNTKVKCIHLGASTTKTQASSIFLIKESTKSNHYYLTYYTNAGQIYLFFMSIFYRGLIIKRYLRNIFNKFLYHKP